MGMVLLVTGVVGILVSTVLEWKMREPVYSYVIKISSVVFAIGCALHVWS